MQFTSFAPRAIGEGIRADWARSVERAIMEQRPRPNLGQTMSRNSYGVMMGEAGAAAKTVEYASSFPFKVRWQYTNKKRTAGEWQIFLPLGCVSVVQGNVTNACIPVNAIGKDDNGQELYKWYRIEEPKDADGTVGTFNGYLAKQWTVYVIIKPWPRMKACTSPEDSSFKAGMWSVPVATINVIETDKDVLHGVNQIVSEGGIVREWKTDGAFAIEYEMESAKEPGSNVVARIINQRKALGRLYRKNADPVVVTGWDNVWVKITHEDTEFDMSVEKDLSGKDAVSDDDKTVFQIYRMKDNIPVEDSRGSIPDFDFYTNASA